MTAISPLQCAKMLVNAGFTGWQVVTMGAILRAESGLDPHAYNLNDHDPNAPSYLSFDWGIGQVNDFYWERALRAAGILRADRPVSMLLLRPAVNVRAVKFVFDTALFVADGDVLAAYEQWNVYKTGAYLPFVHDARVAAQQAGVNV